MRIITLCLIVFSLFTIGVAREKPAEPSELSKDQGSAMASSSEQTVVLVFYRPKRFVGGGLTPSVYVNGEQVARLDNGRFFVLTTKPGTVKIESSMKHDPVEAELKAGKVQFYEMVILSGNWRGGGRLIPTGANDAKEVIKKLKPLDKKWVTSDRVTFTVPEETAAAK